MRSKAQMAVKVALDSLSLEVRKSIVSELTVSSQGDYMGYGKQVTINPYVVEDNDLYLPFYYGNQKLGRYPGDTIKFSRRDIAFEGKLRDYQTEVVKDAIDRLNKVRCVFLALATGKGKTPTSIYLASRLKVKTAVIIHRDVIFDGWIKRLASLSPRSKVQVLDSKNPIDKDADFYLISPLTALKRDREDFSDIGLLIVDEAHTVCSEKQSGSLLQFTPKWCFGLSATPDRSDKLDKIIDLHFGPYHIVVPLWVEHVYYKFETGLVPEVKLNARGHTDWDSVLKFQASHPERNDLIVKVCSFFKERNILVLCKRKVQAITLFEMLKKEGESVDYTTGTKKKFNEGARILVTTFSKSGVGFDHDKLDMLVLAGDVEELFDQYFGRCVRKEDSSPIVVDFVDNFKNLHAHYLTRRKYAISIGGTIKDFRKEHPEFFRTDLEIELL